MRVALRGCFATFHVSQFHRSRSRFFLGAFCVCWVFVWLFFGSLFSHDFEIAPVLPMLRIERPSELSWRARHGVKKKRTTN